MLADHIIRTYPDFYKYFGEKEFTWNKIRQMNRNPLLFMDIGADGLKTGNIDDSGFNLVGSAVENGQRLILAISGCKTGKERADESRKLLLWGFRSFEAKTLFAAGEVIGAAKVYGGRRGDVPLVADNMIRIFVPRGSGRPAAQGALSMMAQCKLPSRLGPKSAGSRFSVAACWRSICR